jgi:hypothetical protein
MAARAALLGKPDAAQRIVDDCIRIVAQRRRANRSTGEPADRQTG